MYIGKQSCCPKIVSVSYNMILNKNKTKNIRGILIYTFFYNDMMPQGVIKKKTTKLHSYIHMASICIFFTLSILLGMGGILYVYSVPTICSCFINSLLGNTITNSFYKHYRNSKFIGFFVFPLP